MYSPKVTFSSDIFYLIQKWAIPAVKCVCCMPIFPEAGQTRACWLHMKEDLALGPPRLHAAPAAALGSHSQEQVSNGCFLLLRHYVGVQRAGIPEPFGLLCLRGWGPPSGQAQSRVADLSSQTLRGSKLRRDGIRLCLRLGASGHVDSTRVSSISTFHHSGNVLWPACPVR